ncbi:hypothetical protein PENTCL1PPCAC_20019, partial [Pristionchus entomophagus]
VQRQGGVIHIGSKLIKTSGGSLVIYRGTKMKNGEEKNIFKDLSIRFLLPIENPKNEKSTETAFFLAISDRRLAIFRPDRIRRTLRDSRAWKFRVKGG